MKLSYSLRFLLTAVVIALAAYFWSTDGVDRGLDLKGGASLTYRLNMKDIPAREHETVLLNTVRVIEERINSLGLKDVKVDALPPTQFEVQFPGRESTEVERIKELLTRLGRLEFRIRADETLEEAEARKKQEMGDAYPGAPKGYAWIPPRAKEGRETLVIIEEWKAQSEIDFLEGRRTDPKIANDESASATLEKQIEAATQARDDVLKQHYFTGGDLAAGQLGIQANPKGPGYVVAFGLKPARVTDFTNFTERNLKKAMTIIIDGKVDSSPVIQDILPGRGIISGGGLTGAFTREDADDLVTVLRSGSLEVDITIQSEFAIGPSLGEASIRRGVLATAIGFGAVVLFMVGTYLFPGLIAVFAVMLNLLLIMGALAFVRAQLSLPGIAGLILTVGMAVDANILVFERIREERKLGKSLAAAVKAGYDRAFITIIDANVTTLFTALILWFFTTGQVRGFAATLIGGILGSMFTALFVTKTVFGWMIEKGWVTDLKMPDIFRLPKISFMKIRLPMITVSLIIVVAGFLGFQSAGKNMYDIEFTGGQRVVIALKHELPIQDVKARIAKGNFQDASVVSIKSDQTASSEALDLAVESNSFQITVAADSQTKRDEVIAFINREFADDLAHEGLTIRPDAGSAGKSIVGLHFTSDVDQAKILEALETTEGVIEPEVISSEGTDTEVRLAFAGTEENFRESLQASLSKTDFSLSTPMPMKSFVDPQTAQRHRDDAMKAVVISLIFQILYIYFRFHGASFGFAAVIALLHDVLVTLGAIALFNGLGLVNVKINLPIIAAILTLIGYSMNDSIVVFDRIRENLGRGRANLSEIIDLSVNQTMTRTIRTSITTLLVVFAVFFVNYGAASVLEGFSFVLIIGVLTGTYSSIFVASPMLLFLPWHYLRGKGKLWAAVAVSLCAWMAGLFTEPGSTGDMVTTILMFAYPAYFVIDLIRWLMLKDADRALNIALRSQGNRV